MARKAEVEALKQQLEQAPDVRAKREIIETYRAGAEQKRTARDLARSSVPAEDTEKQIAKLRLQAGTNQQAQARVQALEQRLRQSAKIKEKLTAIEAAEGETKRELIEEFRVEREKFAEERKQENATFLAQRSQQSPQELPPAMQAVKAKAEERKQEIEDLKAALEQAQPEQRRALINAYRQEQQTARAARQQEIQARQQQESPAQP